MRSLTAYYDKPVFRACARHPHTEDKGFLLYYTDQCPFTYYWAPRIEALAKEQGLAFKMIHITDCDMARNVPSPVTNYALFRDGVFVTHEIQGEAKFLKLAGMKEEK